ncbi:MAG: TonB-dependent receptor [Saprospirales bacterium]|nr:MAG: TonB-dependent receptor [Saprospirales bacterium]
MWFFLFTLFFQEVSAQHFVRGVVVDETRRPLPGATVCTYPDTICTSADINGVFEIRRRTPARKMEVRYVGFETKEIEIDLLDPPDHFHVRMKPADKYLDEILIGEDRIARDVFQPVQIIGRDLFETEAAGNFSEALSRLPGLNSISMGVGVGKPVIRGLYSNRVIVTDHGVKQESHQWGTDHGLEIDQFRPGVVEVVKGPTSLEHGSDGLGGTLRIRPDPIAEKNRLDGRISGIGKSNNNHYGVGANLSASGEKLFGSVNLNRHSYADYRVPAENFVYNTFELPIHNERLKNTAGRESAMSITTGFRDDNHLFRISFSEYQLESGIFPGAFGLPNAYSLAETGDDRLINLPKQEANHRQLAVNYTRIFSGEERLEFTAGLQRNKRREFSFPEFHAIPNRGSNERLALLLDLTTVSLDAVYRNGESWSAGVNFQNQKNEIGGFDYFLPPFETLRLGGFATRKFDLSERTDLSAGLRLDYGRNKGERAGRKVWDTSGGVIDSLISPEEDRQFFNFAASTGFVHRLELLEGLEFSAQLGKSFRIPYPVETSANGVHHGTFRHEKGLPGLKSEHGYQLDLGMNLFRPGFFVAFSPYFYYFNNYIYLRPGASFSPLPDAGQLYQYEQHDVIYAGFEIEWEVILTRGLSLNQGFEVVWNHNLDTRLPLPFTPPASVRTELKWQNGLDGSWIRLTPYVAHRYSFSQNRVDRNELKTPGYHLVNAGIQTVFPGILDGLQMRFQVHNLADEKYFNHLSRYRQIGIPEQGRNYTLQVNLPFTFFL